MFSRSAPVLVALSWAIGPLAGQQVTGPKQSLGFNIGDDYQLATYTQLTEYWKKLDAESDRIVVVSIGKTAEGRDQLMAIVTSPANHARLDRLRTISSKLARAEGVTDEEARAMAKEGKAVVWIDGGLHATEVLGAAQLMEHVYQMASRSDEETLRLLDDVVQLVVHANPDGMELVSNWYLRRSDPLKRTTAELPRLYQKYIGHDNNRDLYMNAMPESKNMSRVMYREWNPQIMYNHHQTGPAGAVMFAPPFRDPHNYLIDPILINSLNVVGTIMHNRFAQENKPGVVQRESASYQTWWNGGLRTTAYFHNMIGILTETIGSPTPMSIPLVPDRLVADGNGTFPIMPGPWKFRQSVDYSITANRAILDYASRYREHLLYNVYLMGRSAIAKGSQDSWTIYPKRVAAMQEEAAKEPRTNAVPAFGARTLDPKYFAMLRKPEDRDPRGYVLPSDQPDFLTATKFVNALIESGVEVHRSTAAFAVGGVSYPSGSYVIKAAQAFRAHVLDLMEPQDYPNDIPYPGGPPKAPYDNAGYTLAMQMGVEYDRIREAFDCPCAKVPDVLAKPPVTASLPSAGRYRLARSQNDSYLAVNRLLAAKQRVEATATDFVIPASGEATRILRALVEERGLVVGVGSGSGRPVKPVRVGLWDQYGGSMPSGWVRWILERFEFPFEVVFVKRLDAGSLNQGFDVLVFVDGAIPTPPGAATSGNPMAAFFRNQAPPSDDIPAEFKEWLGRVTAEKTIPALKSFLEAGGRIVTIGGSTALARHLGLPVDNHLVERTPTGAVRPIPRERFYVPASLLEVTIDTTAQSAFGMGSTAVVMFDESPVFRLLPDAPARGVKPVAWFATAQPLRSGWAWGQTYLEGGIAAVEAQVGRGKLYLYGPEVTFRSQPHGTYRFLFNGLLGE
ncbi:MAG: peptidase [Gemmatimonadetes bacterium]|nr:peptidase [Gemmatimonadota bacterium]